MEGTRIDAPFVEAFKARTKKQAVSIIKFLKTIRSNEEIYVIKRQLIRSSTSVAANYRAACRARSKAEFTAKLGISHEEADETLFWLEMIEDLDYRSPELEKLKKESDEILRIIAKSVSTSRNTQTSTTTK